MSCDKEKKLLEIKQYVEKEGYILLVDEKVKCYKNLMLICPNGHKIKMAWKSFEKGNRCPFCRVLKNKGRNLI